MVDDGVYKVKDGVGYDVYFNGKLVGWTRTAQEGNKLYNEWEEAEARKRQKQSKENETKMADNEEEERFERLIGEKKDDGNKKGVIDRIKGAYQRRRNVAQQQQGQQATGTGGSTFSPTIIKSVIKSGSFWNKLIVIIAAVIVIILVDVWGWRFTHLGPLVNKVLPFAKIIGLGFWIILLLVCFGYGIKKVVGEGDFTVLFCTGALLIWLMDRLGRTYVGFNFDWLGTLRTDWLAIGTSTVIIIGLAIFTFKGILENNRMWIIGAITLILILRVLNWIAKSTFFASLNISYGTLGFIVIALIFGISMYLSRGLFQAESYWSFLLMLFILSYFWINFNWTRLPDGTYNWKAIIHMIYILAFGILYMRPLEERNPTTWHLLLPAMIIIDFFYYDLISDSTTFGYFPMLPILVLAYCVDRKKDAFATFMLILVVAFIFFMFAVNTFGLADFGNVQFEGKEGAATESIFDRIMNELKSGVAWAGQSAEKRLYYATGGLLSEQFPSLVEKNQFEPLGVVFERVKPAQPRFYTDEPVTVWGTIKSRTLSDPVNIDFTCFRFKDNKQVKADTTTTAEAKDIIIPDKPFTVYTLEEKDVECTFGEKKLQAGTNTLILAATYNFPTIAYHKVYFIDAERHRAMIRENLDPLKEFGIADKYPKSISTNGPVEIGVGILNLIPVSDKGTSPALFITLTNRGKITDSKNNPVGKWTGKIKEIKELNVVLPKGITIDWEKETTCRPVRFKTFSKTDCKSSCSDLCTKKCEGYQDAIEKRECIDDCDAGEGGDSIKRCNDDCDNLFKSDIGAEDYTGYQLAVENIKYRDDKDKFSNLESGRFLTFSCRLNINKNDVLENVPITTKFIRIRARYDYVIQSQVPVTVEELPTIAPTPITYAPSNIDLDIYLRNKKSPMEGLGQCIKNAEQRTNVPSIVMLGVAGQESRFGSSGLALNSKNIFSITCGNYDKSDKCTLPNKQDCCKSFTTYKGTVLSFRQYQDFCESVNDFADFIINPNGRFAGSMQYVKEPEKMVQEISKAGYAEEGQQWADAVIKIMRDTQTQITNIVQAQPQTQPQPTT